MSCLDILALSRLPTQYPITLEGINIKLQLGKFRLILLFHDRILIFVNLFLMVLDLQLHYIFSQELQIIEPSVTCLVLGGRLYVQ